MREEAKTQMTIKTGVMGVGRMGVEHCYQIEDTEGFELVAVSSRAEERRRTIQYEFDVKIYPDHTALLADPEVELVVIATHTSNHEEWAIKALEAGKHVVVEKPMCLSLEGAERMIATAEECGRVLTVHQNRRWDQDFQTVRKIVEDGLLGEPFAFESRVMSFYEGWPAWGAEGMANPWRIKKAYGGGLLMDWGPHLIDQVLLLVPSPVVGVFGDLQSRIWATEVDDHFKCILRFEDGTIAQVEASNNALRPLPRWYILGTKGTLWSQGGNPLEWGDIKLNLEYAGVPQELTFEIDQPELSTGFYPDLYEALTTGREPAVKLSEARRVMQVLDAVRESARTGEVVRLS